MRQWYRMQASAADPSVVEIYIIDFIGDWIDEYYDFGVTAKSFVEQLAQLSDAVTTIRLHVNSPGGDVFAALNIANALRDQRASKKRTVEVLIDGLAASAASILIMAGNTIRIGDNALVMVHNPWWVAIGSAADMRKAADNLEKIRETIIATYRWQSSLSEEALGALMDAETWMDADEAVANGFATEKIEGLKAAASLDPRALAKLTVPERYRARVDALLATPAPPAAPPAPAEVLRLCREGACLDLAEGLVTAGATLDQVQATVATARETRSQAAARASQIRGLCNTAKLSELADGYLQGAMPIDAIRAQLTVLTAKLDQIEIDGSLNPNQGVPPKVRIDVGAVYADRNRLRAQKE
jgi:ATP-dependent protease ClpP protease subunit